VDVHNTSEVLFRLCANTDPPSLRYGAAGPQHACPPKPWRRRNSIFTKGPSDVLDHATSEIASGSKLGIDATKKLPGEGFKRSWPPLIRMSESPPKN
jgi:4-hydroxy-3-polyprenylbenzoate decarboxylase